MVAKTTHGVVVVLGGVTLAGVTSVKVSPLTRSTIDVTDHDTTSTKEYIPEDLSDQGDCVVTMNYVAGSTTDDACIAAMSTTAGSPNAVTITVKAAAGTETIGFDAYGTSYEISELPAGGTDKQTAMLTLKAVGTRTQA